jgi:hypothetical protein
MISSSQGFEFFVFSKRLFSHMVQISPISLKSANLGPNQKKSKFEP